MFKLLRDTCINQLENMLEKDIVEECREFIEIRREREKAFKYFKKTSFQI